MRKHGTGRGSAVFFSCILCVFACAHLLPGVSYDSIEDAVLAGALLGSVYVAVRPMMRLLTGPIGCLTLGLTNTLLDVGIIYLCQRVIDGFSVDGIGWALGMALFVNVICGVVGGKR